MIKKLTKSQLSPTHASAPTHMFVYMRACCKFVHKNSNTKQCHLHASIANSSQIQVT